MKAGICSTTRRSLQDPIDLYMTGGAVIDRQNPTTLSALAHGATCVGRSQASKARDLNPWQYEICTDIVAEACCPGGAHVLRITEEPSASSLFALRTGSVVLGTWATYSTTGVRRQAGVSALCCTRNCFWPAFWPLRISQTIVECQADYLPCLRVKRRIGSGLPNWFLAFLVFLTKRY